jgi:probable HAF family extracellular repeat protein
VLSSIALRPPRGGKICIAISALVLISSPSSADDFGGLGFLPSTTSSTANGISADGTVVVGYSGLQAYSWTETGGMVGLGFLPGQSFSNAIAASGDGSVVVGYSEYFGSSFGRRAFRWTLAGGMVSLGTLTGSHDYSAAHAVNADGSVVVGISGQTFVGQQAFRWTQADGMLGLGFLPGKNSSAAVGVSGDGNIVVGGSRTGEGADWVAFRWTQGTGMTSLGFLSGGTASLGQAISSDGQVIVGWSSSTGSSQQAFRWTQGGGMAGLGFLGGGNQSVALATNANGAVIVGYGNTATTTFEAFRWTAASGMIGIKDMAVAAGLSMTGWQLTFARGVSGDGNVMVGDGIDPSGKNEAWIYRLSAPGSGGPGFTTVSNVAQSFASLQGLSESAHGIVNAGLGTLAEIGLHHSCGGTCFNLYSVGSLEKTASFDDPALIGTAGVTTTLARRFSIGATIGAGYHHDKLQQRGHDEQRSVSGGLHAAYAPDRGINLIAAGYATRVWSEIDRGYLNGTSPVTSHGETDGWGIGGLVRLGFAARLAPTLRVMPFADYEVTRIHYDGWTETSGPFPASFGAIDDVLHRSRVGLEGRYYFTPASYLWSTAAWGHRFDDNTAAIGGQLVGLFPLSIAGSPTTRDWAETTAGVNLAMSSTVSASASVGARFDEHTSTITAVRAGLQAKF